MKALDTIMSNEERQKYLYKVSTSPEPHAFTANDGTLVSPNVYNHVRVDGLLQAQAAISFKAGHDQAMSKLLELRMESREWGIKKGRKEVMELLNYPVGKFRIESNETQGVGYNICQSLRRNWNTIKNIITRRKSKWKEKK